MRFQQDVVKIANMFLNSVLSPLGRKAVRSAEVRASRQETQNEYTPSAVWETGAGLKAQTF